jgi:hypothetical protein
VWTFGQGPPEIAKSTWDTALTFKRICAIRILWEGADLSTHADHNRQRALDQRFPVGEHESVDEAHD